MDRVASITRLDSCDSGFRYDLDPEAVLACGTERGNEVADALRQRIFEIASEVYKPLKRSDDPTLNRDSDWWSEML